MDFLLGHVTVKARLVMLLCHCVQGVDNKINITYINVNYYCYQTPVLVLPNIIVYIK